MTAAEINIFSCASAAFIKPTSQSDKINLRNPDFRSVLKADLIAIKEARKGLKPDISSGVISIPIDRLDAILHLINFSRVANKTSVMILNDLKVYHRKTGFTSNVFFQIYDYRTTWK